MEGFGDRKRAKTKPKTKAKFKRRIKRVRKVKSNNRDLIEKYEEENGTCEQFASPVPNAIYKSRSKSKRRLVSIIQEEQSIETKSKNGEITNTSFWKITNNISSVEEEKVYVTNQNSSYMHTGKSMRREFTSDVQVSNFADRIVEKESEASLQDESDVEKVHSYWKWIKRLMISEAIFIILSVIVAILANEIYESRGNNRLGGDIINGDYDTVKMKKDQWLINLLRCINLMISFVLILIEILSNHLRNKVKADGEIILSNSSVLDRFQKDPLLKSSWDSSNCRNSCLKDIRIRSAIYSPSFIEFILKILIFTITSPPGYDLLFEGTMLGGRFSYTLDGIIMLITLHRLAFIVSIYFLMSKWNKREFRQLMCDFGLDKPDEKSSDSKEKVKSLFNHRYYIFFLKLEVKYYPLRLSMISIMFFIYCSFILSYLEKSFESDFTPTWDKSSKENNFWLSMITMTTVGYGDGYPSTHLGRFILILAVLFGKLIISIVYNFLNEEINFDKYERKAYEIVKDQMEIDATATEPKENQWNSPTATNGFKNQRNGVKVIPKRRSTIVSRIRKRLSHEEILKNRKKSLIGINRKYFYTTIEEKVCITSYQEFFKKLRTQASFVKQLTLNADLCESRFKPLVNTYKIVNKILTPSELSIKRKYKESKLVRNLLMIKNKLNKRKQENAPISENSLA
jgi:preprotein translocase subunit SecG